MDSGNWRESLQQCIPQRKVHDREQEKIEFDPMRIKTEEQLFRLPIVKLTKFEFRKALERHCIKNGLALTYHIQENNLKQMEKDGIDTTGISRYIIKACVDGKEVGEGRGGNMRIATAYASWRGLYSCGVYS